MRAAHDPIDQLRAVLLEAGHADEAAFKERILEMQQAIDAANERLATIKGAIEKAAQQQQKTLTEMAAARQSLQQARAATRAKIQERNEMRERVDALKDQREAVFARLQRVRDGLRYQSVERIDEAIAELEYKLASTSVPLKEEKEIVAEISRLNGSKAAVRDFDRQMEAHKKEREENKAIVDQMKALNAEIAALLEAEKKHAAMVDGIQRKIEGAKSSVNGLYRDRDGVVVHADLPQTSHHLHLIFDPSVLSLCAGVLQVRRAAERQKRKKHGCTATLGEGEAVGDFKSAVHVQTQQLT